MPYTSDVLALSPVAYWKLDDASGSTTFADSSGNGRTATVFGSPAFGGAAAGAGLTGSAITVLGGAGSGAIVAAGSAGYFAGLQTFTVSFWFKTTDTGVPAIFSTSNQSYAGSDARNHLLIRMSGGTIQTFAGTASGYAQVNSPQTWNDGNWHMLAYTATGGTIRLYVDGVQRATGSYSGSLNAGTGTPLRVGSSSNSATNVVDSPFNGGLDEVALFGSALSATDISNLFTSGNTAPALRPYADEVLSDAPLAYYRLGEASGSTMVDSSGNGRNGTYTGMTLGVSGAVAGSDTSVKPSSTTSRGLVPGAAWMDQASYTVEAWVRLNPSSTSTQAAIVSRLYQPGVAADPGWVWAVRHGGSGQIQVLVYNGGVTTIASSNVTFDLAWHHVALTFDGLTLRLYVDGSLATSLAYTPRRNAVSDFVVGNLRSPAGDDLTYAHPNANVDEVAFYGAALSQARLQAHYNAASIAPAGPKTGTASGAFSFAGSAAGRRVTAGVAAGALAFSGAALGSAPVKGAAVGSIAYGGTATGVAPAVGPRTGSASGSFTFAGTATGSAPVKGSGSGAFSFTGTAAGVTPAVGMKYGTATGSLSWVGAATGAPANRAGSAVGTLSWVGAAAGSNTAIPMGSAAGTVLWRGVAFGANGTTTIPGWDVDDSGQTSLGLGGSGELDAMPPLALPPAGYVERPLIRRSVVVPALHTISGKIVDPTTGAIRIPDDVYDALPLAAPVAEVGVPHILFPNIGDLNDVTYFRGGIIRIGNMRMEEPFGDVTLDIEIPLLTSMDPEPDVDNPDDPLFWTMNRANVEIVLRHPDATITRLWAGHIISHDIGNDSSGPFRRLTAVGSLRQAATDVLKVPNMLDPTDIGTLIPRALNGVASRRYPKVGFVNTGIMSRQRGSWSDSPLGYAQSLLSTAWTPAGNQWTIGKVEGSRRTYEMRPKDTVPTLTVTNGARGVEVDLTRDATSTRNVIYGHGVASNGYAWWNYKYPNLTGDTAPLYPGSLMGLGASGAGVSLWQQRVKDLGYSIAVDGTISSSDVLIIKTVQRRFGVQVDGVIGPQTWAATFDVGGNGGDLSGVIRLPLAADPRTQPYLYNADGSVAGDNPDFDRNVIIYADDVDFGSGITRAEGIASAQQILERESEPGLTGRIVLNSDPREMSRFLIRPGRKIKLVGFEQADRVLHISAVDIDWQSLSVTLEVDEKSRDAMTVAQIRERDKEARRDPARRPGNVNRRSRLDVDQVVPFDGESGAGRIPKFATFGGLWSVIRIPVSETGRVAMVDMQTVAPATELYVAMFGAPIQPAHLVKYVGNPNSTSAKWEQNRAVLEDTFGWIEAFGSPDEPGGYWPGLKSNSSPLTGRLKDTGGFEYVSAKPPWVWVAVFTPTSSYVSGRVLPAPVI